MLTYRIAKRRNAKGWDVLREFDGSLSLVSQRGEALSKREALQAAQLLVGWRGTVVAHDKEYPLAQCFPQSPFATSHI